jgi:hypothetical protein
MKAFFDVGDYRQDDRIAGTRTIHGPGGPNLDNLTLRRIQT